MNHANDELLRRLDRLVAYRRMSRWKRLLRRPLITASNSVAMRAFNLLFALGRVSEKETKTYFDESMTVFVPSGYGDVYLYGATLDADAEVRLNKFLLRELDEGRVFFDIGACLGYYSLLASKLVGPKGAVHSFEPSPPLVPLLRRNLGGKPNVHLVNKALSKTAGSTQFFVSPLPFVGCSSLRADWLGSKAEPVVVETIRLDDYCGSTGIFPDIIKLDAEGVEDEILLGSEKLLRDKAPLIVLEVFSPPIDSDRRALRILQEHGYEPHTIQDDGRLKAQTYETMDSYLLDLKAHYRLVNDSPNDFDNMVFKRRRSNSAASE